MFDEAMQVFCCDALLGIDMVFGDFLLILKNRVKQKAEQGRFVPVQMGQFTAQGLLELFRKRHRLRVSGGCYNYWMNRQNGESVGSF